MTKKQKQTLAIGGGLVAVGVVAYLVYKSKHPAALPANPNATTIFTVAPGTAATPVPLSLANRGTLSIMAPTGATLGTVSIAPSGVLTLPTSGANYDYVAAGKGTATVTVPFTDSAGAAQTSTFQVVVT